MWLRRFKESFKLTEIEKRFELYYGNLKKNKWSLGEVYRDDTRADQGAL